MSDKSLAINAVCSGVSQAIQTVTRSIITLIISRVTQASVYSNIFTSSQEMCIDHNSAVKTITAFFTGMCYHCSVALFCMFGAFLFNMNRKQPCRCVATCLQGRVLFLKRQCIIILKHSSGLCDGWALVEFISSLNSWWVCSPLSSQSSIALLHDLGQAEVKFLSICFTPLTSVRMSLEVND